MRNTLLSLALLSAFASSNALAQAAAAPASPHTFTGNIALVSDYRFRGISQTFEGPALQGGFDYSHSSGIYLGNWNSSINEGAGFPEASLEMDFYGGFKKSWGDWGIDVGAIYYYYPSSDANLGRGTAFVNPRDATKIHTGDVSNFELYIGGSWKTVSLKYYYAMDDYFSLPETQGSDYFDLSGSYDLGNGWGINGHVGWLSVKDWHNGTEVTDADYTDWKIGVTKDIGGWVIGASYVESDAKGSCNVTNPGFYCFSDTTPFDARSTKDAGEGTVVVSISKSF